MVDPWVSMGYQGKGRGGYVRCGAHENLPTMCFAGSLHDRIVPEGIDAVRGGKGTAEDPQVSPAGVA